MKLKIIRVDLPLRHVTIVNSNSISVVRSVIVELEQDGLRGYGEVCEDSRFGVIADQISRKLEGMRDALSSYALADPIAFGRLVSSRLEGNFAAQSALEMAGCDLWGKMLNRPLGKLWGFDNRNTPCSSHTLTLDSVFRILEKYDEFPNWPVYRVKLGSSSDMEILRELRKKTTVPFRVDMNGTWTLQRAMSNLDELKSLGVELIEQPIHQDDWKGMAALKEISPIPIFADESCRSESDLEKCAEVFDGVNLKPMKFGGLFPTLQVLGKAKHLGLQTMIGNTFESTIAASAAAQFASQLDFVYVDGPLLIERKMGCGVQLELGKILYPEENGTGVCFYPEKRKFENQ